jgi:hypothetical protein
MRRRPTGTGNRGSLFRNYPETVILETVLKGRGFSRAARGEKRVWALAPEGMYFSTTCIPSAAKAASPLAASTARLKPCPFKATSFYMGS